MHNPDYNPEPGTRIENITFRNVSYTGDNAMPNRIYGFDQDRAVDGVTFIRLQINGQTILQAEEGHFHINEHARSIKFLAE
ncbi:hypothetical protein QNH46_16700 [Paenibacillus woosongensis]|uniref:Uncharacterized protein n=1 Tax=Paenibacillus woosongensis TaxID=307580 RepID=A0AA95HZM2_9BACL|nr:hypothetical protein [Paenibacillus woosongensis]WHX47774.1 hypothetical protein QNH46_16700 [Paenibacillus woosongensis]